MKKYNKEFAMKEMLKKKILDKRSEKGVIYERDLLQKMHHTFIVNMYFSFQDTDYLYLVMDLLTGGDLRYHLCTYDKFPYETSSKNKIYIIFKKNLKKKKFLKK